MDNPTTQYSFGGDEFIFVQLSEEMNLVVNFRVIAITNEIEYKNIPGVLGIFPANTSYMLRINPDEINPLELIERLKWIENSLNGIDHISVTTRLVDIPIYFEDPWTYQTMMKFRDRHQDPESTDLEYAAKINGFDSKESFISALTDSPFVVTMTSVVPGIPWCFQITPNNRRIEVPKYVRPRTFTPERAFGFGGAFAVIYPAQGAGGYQIFGIAPAPIHDKNKKLVDFQESVIFPQQGDIFKFRSIDKGEYESIREEVNEGTFEYLKKDYTFTADNLLDDPSEFSKIVLRRLYHD